MNDFIHSLADASVRQLAWACFSEPIIADFSNLADKVTAPAFELHEQRMNWLRELDRQPRALHLFLDEHCKSKRLGLRYESFWHFFLQEDPATHLIAHNLPIYDNGRTLGELDVLYHCHERNQTIHLELAVKFFMATEVPARKNDLLSYWLGPNSNDRLDIKWQRMQSHQLALINSEAATQALAELGIHKVQQEVSLRGWLFHPGIFPNGKKAPLHPAINPRHEKGRWLTRSQFFAENSVSEWRYLAKPHWFGDIGESEELGEEFLKLSQRRAIMLIHSERRDERLMLAPDDWPSSITSK